jgi:MarR family transcriptional regulator, transcriptional regulator for hemolysin
VRRDSEPVGLEVARTGRLLNRAFDEALAGVGGSAPMWLIVTALKRGEHTRQREIAAAIGLEDATLTHHLHRMEEAGLVTRHREPTNRRNQMVVLTADGEALFERMLSAVWAFDQRLRRGLTAAELDRLRMLLGRLRTNAGAIGRNAPH